MLPALSGGISGTIMSSVHDITLYLVLSIRLKGIVLNKISGSL